MTFIEMLQQGGYILPQYSSGQQTFQAPNSGMQTLQSMMAVDQAAQQRYVQGEQLNLQRSQNTQGMINSAIQNELNRKTQERLQQQMDLANSQLEFNMKKETIAQLDEDRVKMNQMFLSRDIPAIEKELADAGLDDAGILKQVGDMKGTQAFDATMKLQSARRAIMAKYKNGYTNKQTWSEGKKRVDAAAAQIDKAKFLFENNLINSKVYKQYWDDLQKSTDDLVRFENGNLQAIDFNSSQWTGIAGAPSFLDEAAYDAQVKSEAKLRDIEIKTKELAAEKGLYDYEQDKLDRPEQRQVKMLDNLKSYADNAGFLKILSEHNIPVTSSSADIMSTVNSMLEPERTAFFEKITAENMKQKQTQSAAATVSIDRLLNEAIQACNNDENSPECAKIAKLKEEWKFQNPSKSDINIDGYGAYTGTDSNRQYDSQGVIRNNLGQVKAINATIGDSTSRFIVEDGQSNKNKGKVKVTTKSGTAYYHEIEEVNGQPYIKISKDNKGLAYLKDVLGTAEKAWYGMNDWEDYLNESAGAAHVSKLNPGVEISEDKSYILIPTTPFSTSEAGAGSVIGGSGTNWGPK